MQSGVGGARRRYSAEGTQEMSAGMKIYYVIIWWGRFAFYLPFVRRIAAPRIIEKYNACVLDGTRWKNIHRTMRDLKCDRYFCTAENTHKKLRM